MDTYGGRVPQGFNQAFLFRFLSSDVGIAVDACVSVTGEIANLCAELGADLIVLVLPSKPEVDIGDDAETVQAILDSMSLTSDDYAINTRMAARYMDALRERGIAVLDPAPTMRAEPTPLYWREDYHLNVAGHALIAKLLLPECLAWIETARAESSATPEH
jgi:hypothetical protein